MAYTLKKVIPDLAKQSMAQEEPAPPQRGKHRNRVAGHGYELSCRDIFRNIGFAFLVTCRSESKSRDDQKIDLINRDEEKNGRFPYNIQCKNVAGIVNYHRIFAGYDTQVKLKKGPDKGKLVKKRVEGMPRIQGIINVILHKYTEREERLEQNQTGDYDTRVIFQSKGYYAILLKQDFLQLVAERLELQRLTEENKQLKAELKDAQDNLAMIVQQHNEAHANNH